MQATKAHPKSTEHEVIDGRAANLGAIRRKARALLNGVAQAEPIVKLRERVREASPIRHDVPLPPALQAERKTITSSRGQSISYYVDRGTAHGRPLVLIHSINACASAYEMKPLFEHYRGSRAVYAVELGGFGFSERDSRSYDPELYAQELVDFLTRVKSQEDAADVIALSLSAELAALVATRRPDLIHSLTLISPTGFDGAKHGHTDPPLAMLDQKKTRVADRWWSQLVYDAIASRRSIAYFLGKSFVGEPDPGLRDYAYATSHQPGARFAPLAFLSGALFTRDVIDTYRQIQRPVLVLFDKDGFTHFDRLPELVDTSPSWTAVRIADTRGMPHFERLADTTRAMDAFWTEQDHAASAHHQHGTHVHAPHATD